MINTQTKDHTFKYQVLIRCFTYNHGHYIEDALKGFVMQETNFCFCAIVVDDCSQDNTAEIIKKYEREYPSIIKGLYLQENYNNRYEEKIELIKHWREDSKYEAFCEGDDYWTDPLKLQKEYDYLESHPEESLVYTDCNVFFQKENKLINSVFATGFFKPTYNYKDFFLERKYLAPCSWLYKIGDFTSIEIPSFVTDGTLFVAFNLLVEKKVGYLADTTCTYRVVRGSASHSNDLKKRYDYLKGVFLTEQHLLNYYSDLFTDEDVVYLYNRRYKGLIPFAIAMNDNELLTKIREFHVKDMGFRNRLMLYFANISLARHYIFRKLTASLQKGL